MGELSFAGGGGGGGGGLSPFGGGGGIAPWVWTGGGPLVTLGTVWDGRVAMLAVALMVVIFYVRCVCCMYVCNIYVHTLKERSHM